MGLIKGLGKSSSEFKGLAYPMSVRVSCQTCDAMTFNARHCHNAHVVTWVQSKVNGLGSKWTIRGG